MRYFLQLGYDGSGYSGWQRQKSSSRTIQEIIEKALFNILKKQITVYGCGRTDAGVHASQYVMHIDLDKTLEFDLIFRLNKHLPNGIVIFDLFEVNENQHCRYDAVARSYDYFIHWKKDPIIHRYSTFLGHLDFDFNLMQQVVALIGETKDFKPLCKQPDLYKNTLCNITECALLIDEKQGRLRFTITSNRFLREMIRYSIFFLVEVGSGKMSLEEFKKILNQETIFKQKKPAPPNGLFLSKIEYPYLKLKDSPHHMIKMLKNGLE